MSCRKFLPQALKETFHFRKSDRDETPMRPSTVPTAMRSALTAHEKTTLGKPSGSQRFRRKTHPVSALKTISSPFRKNARMTPADGTCRITVGEADVGTRQSSSPSRSRLRYMKPECGRYGCGS